MVRPSRRAPGDSFTIGALPSDFVTQGSAGTEVYVFTDATSRPTAIAWQPTNDSVVWFYGTNVLDQTMFDIVRSIDVSTT